MNEGSELRGDRNTRGGSGSEKLFMTNMKDLERDLLFQLNKLLFISEKFSNEKNGIIDELLRKKILSLVSKLKDLDNELNKLIKHTYRECYNFYSKDTKIPPIKTSKIITKEEEGEKKFESLDLFNHLISFYTNKDNIINVI